MLTNIRQGRELMMMVAAVVASVAFFAAEAVAQYAGTYEAQGLKNGSWHNLSSKEFSTRAAAENYARTFGTAYSRYRVLYTPPNGQGTTVVSDFPSSGSGGGTTTPPIPVQPPPPPQNKQSLWQVRAGNLGWNGGNDIEGARARANQLWLQGYNPTIIVDLNGVRPSVPLSFPQDFVLIRIKYRTRTNGAWQTYHGQTVYQPNMPAGVTTDAMRDRWLSEVVSLLRNNYHISLNSSNVLSYITIERYTVSARQYVNQNSLAFPR